VLDTTKPRVPAGTCVYAIGDIHGRLDLLSALHERIEADAARRTPDRRVIVYLGDYVDRGPDSRGVIETLASAPLTGFESVHLKGNHEDFLMRFLVDDTVAPIWLYNGGGRTLESYGVKLGRWPSWTDVQAAFRAAIPEHHRDFLAALQLYHVEGDYAFVHAGILPGVPLSGQRPEDMMWIREEFLFDSRRHDHVIVHGHSIRPQPDVSANRIGIDTGAYKSGVLTALVLEEGSRDFVQTGG
jgi:serine/threonine protein phosphatase 1